MKNQKLLLVIFTLAVLGLACGMLGGSSTGNAPTPDAGFSAPEPSQTATLAASSSAPTGQPDELSGELPPLNYEEILNAGVEAGKWTYEEGLVLFIKYFANQVDEGQLPGMSEAVFQSGTGIVQLAKQYINDTGGNSQIQAELEGLLETLFVPQDILDRISQPESEAGSSRSPVHLAALTNSDLDAQNNDQCLNLETGIYDLLTEGAVCFLYREREITGTTTVRVYFPIWTDDTEEIIATVNDVLDTMEHTAILYDSYSGLEVKNFHFIYWPVEFRNFRDITADIPDREEDVCQFNAGWFSGFENDTQQQRLAREMFNCVINWSFEDTDYYSWWHKGAALYFSNVAYPFGDIEWDAIDHFDVRSTTVGIDHMEEENFVFFQFLGNVYDPQTVVDILVEINTGAVIDWFRYIARDTPGDFTRFVVDYLSRGIPDENTGAAYISPSPPRVTDTITVDEAADYTIQSEYLVAKRYFVDYKKQKRFLQVETYSEYPDSITGVQANLHQNLSAWSSLPPEIRSSCEEDVRYLYVPRFQIIADVRFNSIAFSVTTAEQAVCDPCLLGAWKVDNLSFSEYMDAIFKENIPEVPDIVTQIEGDYFMQFDTEGKVQAQRVDLLINFSLESVANYMPTLNPTAPGPQPTQSVTFPVLGAVYINSNGIGNYSADGKTLKVTQFVDVVEDVASGAFIYNDTGFFGVLGEVTSQFSPAAGDSGVDSDESAPYICSGDVLEITMPYSNNSILHLDRVDQILPTPIPTPSQYDD